MAEKMNLGIFRSVTGAGNIDGGGAIECSMVTVHHVPCQIELNFT